MNQRQQIKINHENRKNELSTPSEEKKGLIFTVKVREASPGNPLPLKVPSTLFSDSDISHQTSEIGLQGILSNCEERSWLSQVEEKEKAKWKSIRTGLRLRNGQ